FDLDGTMLPMDQDEFVKIYFLELCKRFCPELKMDDKSLVKAIWKATGAMIKNERVEPNIDAFWKTFAQICGEKVLAYKDDFDDYYVNEFNKCKKVCGFNPAVSETIKVLRSKGYTTVAATNPIFPAVATNNRLTWAGVSKDDFELVTTYENSSSCKPNPQYFTEIAQKLNLQPAQCLMVGNDIDEDMIAASSLGMDVFLVKECMINRADKDISRYKQGSFKDFLNYARMMPDVK
ncbi:MAG: HAD family hydrolase, partial [Ruminococcus sp.]|nr:HAD family hydrolase [Ruminococcus sp.]